MQDFLGSVRQSLDFRNLAAGGGGENGRFGGLVEKIGTSIRRSRVGLFPKQPVKVLRPIEDSPPIRWRKGELIGCGAFGRVYMGMNLDSGELLAVKQVLIATNNASKEKTQTQIRELEEEVKLLKNLSHPNIVRYLGTAREEESLNILLEFVPGGSISSLLGKFGSFPESVIKMYTKQLLLGLEYLHRNGIMHRDIKGANILVDNKGCIKLADFGASKKVVELATINGAKSMKGTPYWMAPEVILQTGHSFSADIWSVGCTVIEMATGKPPWSQQYQEVAALFHIGTTKSHPPIPEHLSPEANDFLLKCLHKEPHLRPTASEMLQHPFVNAESMEAQKLLGASEAGNSTAESGVCSKNFRNSLIGRTSSGGLKDVCEIGSVRCSTVYPESYMGVKSPWAAGDDDDMCQIDDNDEFAVSASDKFKSISDLNKSFNPTSESSDGWQCKFDEGSEMERNTTELSSSDKVITDGPELVDRGENGFSFQYERSASEDDDEVTEPKLTAFLDKKALQLQKLQTPLYEAYYNTINAAAPAATAGTNYTADVTNFSNLPPKSKSPNRLPSRRFSALFGISPASHEKRLSTAGAAGHQGSAETQLLRGSQKKPPSPSANLSERQRKWKEELFQEIEMRRQAGMGGKVSSPKDRIINRQRDRPRFPLPGQ